jgi:hypothetical protein
MNVKTHFVLRLIRQALRRETTQELRTNERKSKHKNFSLSFFPDPGALNEDLAPYPLVPSFPTQCIADKAQNPV